MTRLRPIRFVARCPLCGYLATAVRYGTEREHLAEHLVYLHVPKEAAPADRPAATP